jgi:hypothetical protein
MKIQIAILVCALASPALGASTPSKTDLARAHAAVGRVLRDPGSAKFSGEVREPGFVCGQVNSRNGYGGYAGATLYLYEFATDRALVVDDGPPSVERTALLDKIGDVCR